MNGETNIIEEERQAQLMEERREAEEKTAIAEILATRETAATTITVEPATISSTDAALMIGLAVMIDALEAALALLIVGLVANFFIDFVAWLIFYRWLKSKGQKAKKGSFIQERAQMILGVTFGFGAIPLLNALPEWTFSIILIVLKERASRAIKAASPI